MDEIRNVKSVVIAIDLTDPLRSVSLSLRNCPKTVTTASGSVIDQITPSAVLEAITADCLPLSGDNKSMNIEYVKYILGSDYGGISQLVSSKVDNGLDNFSEADLSIYLDNGCIDISCNDLGMLYITMAI